MCFLVVYFVKEKVNNGSTTCNSLYVLYLQQCGAIILQELILCEYETAGIILTLWGSLMVLVGVRGCNKSVISMCSGIKEANIWVTLWCCG